MLKEFINKLFLIIQKQAVLFIYLGGLCIKNRIKDLGIFHILGTFHVVAELFVHQTPFYVIFYSNIQKVIEYTTFKVSNQITLQILSISNHKKYPRICGKKTGIIGHLGVSESVINVDILSPG